MVSEKNIPDEITLREFAREYVAKEDGRKTPNTPVHRTVDRKAVFEIVDRGAERLKKLLNSETD